MTAWLTDEQLTMYRLRGYTITMSDGVDGTRRLFECMLDDKLHREDGPAVIHPCGSLEWRLNGLKHREDGPAAIWDVGGSWWYQNGKAHRIDGPAVVHPYGVWWYRHGQKHREDGPAVIHNNGSLEWWLNGDRYPTREGWLAELENGRSK